MLEAFENASHGLRSLSSEKSLRFGRLSLDDRQITYLICVRLRHLLNDFLEGVFRPLM